MRAADLLFAAGALAVAPAALAHRQAGLECLAEPQPSPGAVVPTNVLIFDFAAPILQGPQGPVPTLPAPAPWDFDARYRVPQSPLLPNSAYQILLQQNAGPTVATFTTGAGPDVTPPAAPTALGHFQAPNPGDFPFCMADRVELIPIVPATDDQTPQGDLRYSVSELLPDGGLSPIYAELTPTTLGDGGTVLVLPMGLQGLPDSYVVQARDAAGNLSAASQPQPVDVGPTCDFAESTAGRGPPDLLALWLVGLALLARARRPR